VEAVGTFHSGTRHGKLQGDEGAPNVQCSLLVSEARLQSYRPGCYQPIFKWNSATPWSEMQLYPINVPDASTLLDLLKTGYAKLMWAIILGRVFGYCVKNYYMVNRQAVKRKTQYAGNHAAFSAELASAELLKNQKK
jgi:hypothetical protein